MNLILFLIALMPVFFAVLMVATLPTSPNTPLPEDAGLQPKGAPRFL